MARARRNPNRRARGANNEDNEVQEDQRPAQRPRVAPQGGLVIPQGNGHNNAVMQAQLAALIQNVANNAGIVPQDGDAAPPAQDLAPQDGQVAPADQDEPQDMMLQAALNNNVKKAKKEMLLLIKNEVRSKLWRRIKLIVSPEVKRQAAILAMDGINFRSMRGDSVGARQKRQDFLDKCEGHISKALNEQRSYVQSRIKAVTHAWYKSHDNTMPSREMLLALITRNFDIVQGEVPELDPEDHKKMVWWMTQVLPVAAGNQSDWGPDHHLRMTVQEGHYPESATKLHMPVTTEAIALWILENNYECWPAQWEAKEEHDNDYPIIRKAKDDSGTDLTMETSRASDFVVVLLPFFNFICTC